MFHDQCDDDELSFLVNVDTLLNHVNSWCRSLLVALLCFLSLFLLLCCVFCLCFDLAGSIGRAIMSNNY